MSLYEDLGVEPDATPEAINAAFRRAAKKHHPDAGGDADAFGRVRRAALILRDPAKRARYDADGTMDDGAAAAPDPAIGLLAAALNYALSKAQDIATSDLVGEIRSHLTRELAATVMASSMAGKELRRLTEVCDRLTYKGGQGRDILRGMLDQDRTSLERQRAHMKDHKAAIEAAIAMAADYTFRADPTPDAGSAQGPWLDPGRMSGRRPRFRIDD